MTPSQKLLCVTYLSLPERFSVMSVDKMPEKSDPSTSEKFQRSATPSAAFEYSHAAQATLL
ncbi:hypothetical protein I79_024456 [Cricetulus griseus]|uniref:Uncharacterized protein n=1 Tax=Cricetulus griseus TaxID=10029 RepID=G3IKQ3_CRIGR|nr:hypothetical protein I79_024456 [Cricetulus griseus]